MTIKVYGASDDLIEVDGDIREEFSVYGNEITYLAFSNGTLLGVTYDDDGIWRIRPYRVSGEYKFKHGTDEDSDYSDVIEIPTADWVVAGTEWAKK